MKKILLYLYLLLLCFPASSEPFINSQSIKVNYSGEITGLTASVDNDYLTVHDNYSQHHLITLDKKNTSSLISFDSYGSNETIDTFEIIIWLDNELALINRDSYTLIEPEAMSVKLSSGFDLRTSGKYVSWSNKHQSLIIDTQLFNKQGVKIKPKKSDGNKQHAIQSGQFVNEKNNFYITSGYHSQDIYLWSLPEGKLINEWLIGKWYSSRNITDISMLNDQMFVASDGGEIEARSLKNAEVLWSFSACDTKPYFSSRINNKLFYRCENDQGYIESVNQQWQDIKIDIKKSQSTRLTSVSQTSNPDYIAMGFSNGGAIVYSLKNKKIAQVLLSSDNAEQRAPAYVGYLDKRNQLMVINQEGILKVFKPKDEKRERRD